MRTSWGTESPSELRVVRVVNKDDYRPFTRVLGYPAYTFSTTTVTCTTVVVVSCIDYSTRLKHGKICKFEN
jgi:hypothetical protein